MRFVIRKAVAEAGEPSRAAPGDPGRMSFAIATNKLRERAALGMGELLAQQREVEKMMRTREEHSELPRRCESPDDVTRGLGLRDGDAERVHRVLAETNVEFTPKTGTQRVLLARGRLIEILRSMKHVDSDARVEIEKRAMAFWKHQSQTEIVRAPELRWPVRKALVHTIEGARPVELEFRNERLVKGPWLPGGDEQLETAAAAEGRGPEPRYVAVTGNTYLVRHDLRALGGRWDATSRTWQVPFDRAGEARELVAAAAKRTAGAPDDPTEQPLGANEPKIPDGAVAEPRFDRVRPEKVIGAVRRTEDGLMRVAATSRPEFRDGGWSWTEYLVPAMAHDIPLAKAQSPFPTFVPVGGATNPDMGHPPMPDFYSIYLDPDAMRRQDEEGEKSVDRRKSMWRDLDYTGIHGRPDQPTLRYVAQPMRHYLTASELRKRQKRLQVGTMGYEVVAGESKARKYREGD